eukprot:sb/3473840/
MSRRAVSSYPHTDETGAKEITTYIQNDARTVDYIWYTNHDNTPQNCAHGHSCNTNCRESVLLCDATRRLLTKPELGAMGRLPNEKYGSDHQAIQSWFTIYNTSFKTGALEFYILPLPVAPLECYSNFTRREYDSASEKGRNVLAQ